MKQNEKIESRKKREKKNKNPSQKAKQKHDMK